MPNIALGAGDIAVDRKKKNPCPSGVYMLSGKERYKLTRYIVC